MRKIVMWKKANIVSIVTGALLFIWTGLAFATSPAPFVIYCPSPNEISLFHGLATAPGGWSGRGYVTGPFKKDWKENVIFTTYSTSSGNFIYCEYMVYYSTGDIVLKSNEYPKNYNLYNESHGSYPVDNCLEISGHSKAGKCYFYYKPINTL